MRRGSLLTGLAAAALASCGGAGRTHTRSYVADVKATATTTSKTTAPHARPTSGTTAPHARPPSPALLALRAALSGALAKAGPDTGALVYDLTDRTALFALRAQVKRPPASVEKLYTTVALLSDLGPTATLRTTVLGSGHLGGGGVWHGSLYVRGGGDPTFGDGEFNRVWEQGYGPTSVQLVHQLAADRIRKVTGWVIADPWLFDLSPGGPATNYAPDIPDYGGELSALTYDHGSVSKKLGPPAFAVKEIVLTMKAAHIQARASTDIGHTPVGAIQLASVSSPPLSVLLRLMDVPSDDLFADLFAMQLGATISGTGTLSAGAAQIAQAIASYDVHPTIVDGSGLSRADRSSPREVVYLLRAVWHIPIGGTLWASLPVVGVDGTTQTIATHTPAQGRCVAKTGTLNYVTNLAGYCHSIGGHTLAFALFIDGPGNWVGAQLLGHMVAAIARY